MSSSNRRRPCALTTAPSTRASSETRSRSRSPTKPRRPSCFSECQTAPAEPAEGGLWARDRLPILAGMAAAEELIRLRYPATCEACFVGEETAVAAPVVEIDRGEAGASAAREWKRRHERRETQIRTRHKHLGGLLPDARVSIRVYTAFAGGASCGLLAARAHAGAAPVCLARDGPFSLLRRMGLSPIVGGLDRARSPQLVRGQRVGALPPLQPQIRVTHPARGIPRLP